MSNFNKEFKYNIKSVLSIPGGVRARSGRPSRERAVPCCWPRAGAQSPRREHPAREPSIRHVP